MTVLVAFFRPAAPAVGHIVVSGKWLNAASRGGYLAEAPDPYHAHAEARIVRGTTSADRTPGWRPGYCNLCGAYHERDRPIEHRRILAVMARAVRGW